MSYIELICANFPSVKHNMSTHNFERNDKPKDNLTGYKCTRCNCSAYEIFWKTKNVDLNYKYDLNKVTALTCDEAIIKNIIE